MVLDVVCHCSRHRKREALVSWSEGKMDSGREWAEQCKEDGNKAFRKGEWEEAVGLYLEGVAAVDTMMMHPAEDVKCACYANMAAALMKQEKCVRDPPGPPFLLLKQAL